MFTMIIFFYKIYMVNIFGSLIKSLVKNKIKGNQIEPEENQIQSQLRTRDKPNLEATKKQRQLGLGGK